MYSIKEAAQQLGMSYTWLDRQIRAGYVYIVWYGGHRRVTEEELERVRREGTCSYQKK